MTIAPDERTIHGKYGNFLQWIFGLEIRREARWLKSKYGRDFVKCLSIAEKDRKLVRKISLAALAAMDFAPHCRLRALAACRLPSSFRLRSAHRGSRKA